MNVLPSHKMEEELSEGMICTVFFVLSAFIATSIVQTVYGGLSIADCQLPGLISVCVGSFATSYTITSFIFWTLDSFRVGQINVRHLLLTASQIAANAIIIGILDHRDNGNCQYQSQLNSVGIALLVYHTVTFITNLISYANRIRFPSEPGSEPQPDPEPRIIKTDDSPPPYDTVV